MELALISPVLVILLTGTVEIGMGVFESMQVQAAAEAGALYVANHGSSDLAAVQAAVTHATGTAGIAASPVPRIFCGCPSAAGITAQGSNCTTLCADNTLPGHYVTVSAAIARSILLTLPYLTLPMPATLTGRSTVRVQ